MSAPQKPTPKHGPQKAGVPLWTYKALLVIATAIWGLGTVVIKSTVDDIPPSWIVGVRFTAAGILLALVTFPRIKNTIGDISHWIPGAILGIFVYLSYEANSTGLAFTTASNSAFLTTLYVVIIPFLGWWLNKRRPSKYNLVAALVCIAGVGCVAYAGAAGGAGTAEPTEASDAFGGVGGFALAGLSLNFGDLLTLLSAVFLSFHILLTAKYAPGKNMTTLTVVQFLVAGVLGLITAGATEPFPPLATLPPSAWISLGYLAVFASCLALLLQNIAVARVPAAQASLFLSFESVFGVLFSVLFLGEILTPALIGGFVLIFGSIIISECLPLRAARKVEMCLKALDPTEAQKKGGGQSTSPMPAPIPLEAKSKQGLGLDPEIAEASD